MNLGILLSSGVSRVTKLLCWALGGEVIVVVFGVEGWLLVGDLLVCHDCDRSVADVCLRTEGRKESLKSSKERQ